VKLTGLLLFAKLLVCDLLFTMGKGAVVALIQLYFVLRFHLLPGPLGVIFTISGLAGGIFSLTAPVCQPCMTSLPLEAAQPKSAKIEVNHAMLCYDK